MLGFSEYPVPAQEEEFHYGIYPIDFILEAVLRAGIKWFVENEDAPNKVFGHLLTPYLKTEYGQPKIDEIASYIRKYQITIVQSFAQLDERMPAISIQLLDGSEMTERAGLADYQDKIDIMDANNMVKGRLEIAYSPMFDNVHLGIHTIDTPDLAKYLYYLIVYILNVFKLDFEKLGIYLGTYRATDISKLNDYLPENMYSRFINFSCMTLASYDRGTQTIIENIVGLSVKPGPAVIVDESEEDIDIEEGITVTDEED